MQLFLKRDQLMWARAMFWPHMMNLKACWYRLPGDLLPNRAMQVLVSLGAGIDPPVTALV